MYEGRDVRKGAQIEDGSEGFTKIFRERKRSV